MVYLIPLVYLLFFSIKFDLNSKKINLKTYNLCLRLAYLFMIAIAAFRYRIAPDSVAYAFFFDTEIKNLGDITYKYLFESRLRPLWLLFCSASKSLGGYYTFQFLTSVLTLFTVYFFFRKFSKYAFTSSLIFYITFYHYFSMEILRESVAISLFLWAIIWNYKSPVLSWLLCILTFWIHQFAIVTLFFYSCIKLHIRYSLLIALSLFVFLLFLYLKEPLVTIQGIFNLIHRESFENYDIDRQMSISGYVYHHLKIIFPLIFIFYAKRKQLFSSLATEEIFVKMTIIYILFVAIRIHSVPFMERYQNYLIFFIMVTSASFIIVYLKKQQKLIRTLLFLLSITTLLFYSWAPLYEPHTVTNIPGYKRYYPYNSIFDQGIDSAREEQIRLEAKE